jgi:hypothetical protein
LAEALDKDARAFGHFTLAWLGTLQTAIYAWREAGGMAGTATDVIRRHYTIGN